MKKVSTSLLMVMVLSFAGLVGVLATATAGTNTMQSQIDARAARIFKLDAAKPGHYPSGRVVALSVALGFKDYKGASQLLAQLEGR